MSAAFWSTAMPTGSGEPSCGDAASVSTSREWAHLMQRLTVDIVREPFPDAIGVGGRAT